MRCAQRDELLQLAQLCGAAAPATASAAACVTAAVAAAAASECGACLELELRKLCRRLVPAALRARRVADRL
jgi:hypothetical protein